MRAKNNADPHVCALNLLRTIRGEVPLSRTKGIAREHIDMPISEYSALRADASWVLDTYEPRLDSTEIDVLANSVNEGDLQIAVVD